MGASATHVMGSNSLRLARFRLRVLTGTNSGSVCESSHAELTIGKAEGNDLRLSDATVSRHHCVISVTPEGAELTDLGSTNGTLLASCRVKSALLSPGAQFSVGEVAIAFESMDQELTEPLSESDQFGSVIGSSDEMRRLFAIAAHVAKSDATVLIEGETGTGKSLLAEAIHEASARADGPFVVVDCGAIPPTLIESELFGHERGSFTGAATRHVGLFESAQGGSVLLDEIGELPLALQPKLLGVLENREVRRVGSEAPIRIDVRLMAATNRDLRRAINQGSFRSDLWYRMATVRLRVPPLRERRTDIPLLVRAFYQQLAASPHSGVPDRLLASLPRGDWPGNVRELRAAVESALLMQAALPWQDEFSMELEEPSSGLFDPDLSFRATKLRAMEQWERQYLRELMEQEQSNISRAARAARMDRSHLRALLQRYDMHRPPAKKG